MPTPNFFIVGGPKCGTTALYEYLRRHPEVFLPHRKEPNYFGRRTLTARRPTRETYLALFEDAGDARFLGEASPLTMIHETAAAEIHAMNPEAKIIAMVRDPVAAMYAMFTQCLLNSDEDCFDFAEALEAEPARLRGERLPAVCGDTSRILYRKCATFSPQIERFFKVFGRENVHVVVFDDFAADTAAAFSAVLEFLGAAPHELTEYERINPAQKLRSRWIGRLSKRFQKSRGLRAFGALFSAAARERMARVYNGFERRLNRTRYRRPPLEPQLERRLRAEFEPEVARLGELLGRDLSHWNRMPDER